MAAHLSDLRARGNSKMVMCCCIYCSAAGLYEAADSKVLEVSMEDKDGIGRLLQVCRSESQHRILGFGSKFMLSSVDFYYPLKK